ncbi:MAG: hypothetical protein AB1781_07470 [Pseudomonadota bacterium]
MKLFRRKKVKYEQLPPQVGRNEYISSWFWGDGRLSHLVVDATADSFESKTNYELYTTICAVGLLICGLIAFNVLDPHVPGAGYWVFSSAFIIAPILDWIIKWLVRETRVLTVTSKALTVKRPDGTYDYDMNTVVGVHLYRVDQQRVDKEFRDKRKKKNPEYFSPYCMDLVLETVLGPQALGSIYGLKDAQAIANAINAAIQIMKGRTGAGNGPVVDPRFQYRSKSAGRIPM